MSKTTPSDHRRLSAKGSLAAQNQPLQRVEGEQRFARVVEVLRLRRKNIDTPIDVHETIFHGLPRSSAVFLVDSILHTSLMLQECISALNISQRSWHRIKSNKKDLSKPLDVDQSSRLWSLAEILVSAEEVLGSREEAEEWLAKPALGLNSRRPIDLMSTPQGAELVKTLLTQMEYGVYA